MADFPKVVGSACLIRPPAVEAFRFSTGSITLPLGLAYIAAALDHAGVGVHVIDAVGEGPRTYTRYVKGFLVGLRFEDIVSRVSPDVSFIGITAVFTHEWPAIVRLVTLLKQHYPGVPIVLGGEHVSAMPEFSLATSAADYICMGEGEETIVELAHALISGQDVTSIAGIVYRQDGKIIANPRRAHRQSVDDIPRPAWHLFKVKTYFENHFVGGTDVNEVTIPILATRGCPYQCTFCAAPNMWTTRWIARDPVKVADEIEYYYRTYGAKNFPFQDLTAIVRKDWIIKFCNELIRRELSVAWQFPSGTRSEAIDDEVADLLYRSRMINIAYAPESGSERTRKLIKKKMETEALLKSIRCSLDRGLNVSLFMVLGFPHDNRADMKANLPFIRQIRDLGVTDLPIGLFMALPGTQLFETLFDTGKVRIDPGYFAHILQSSQLIPMRTYSTHMSRYELVWWRYRFYFEFYGKRLFKQLTRAIADSFRQRVGGFVAQAHQSRLQTALSNGLSNLSAAISTYFDRPWMRRRDAIAMMEPWHDVYFTIRSTKRNAGSLKDLPKNEESLCEVNVNAKVQFEHRQRTEIPAALLS